MNKTFALIGAAGYIAPRHMKAIKDTNNNLVAAVDPSDSIGIIDSYFPECQFFTEFERFDRHIEKLKYDDSISLDYTSICSPNYLHDAHIRFALRSGSHAICEKPIVLNPWNIDKLLNVEKNTGRKVYNILQLRVHPEIIALKSQLVHSRDRKYEVDLTYVTSRGNWYNNSWKGDSSKSGGVSTNIGVHFFDMLIWLFGEVQENLVHYNNPNTCSGYLELENARVRWFLSTDKNNLPESARILNQRTFRSIKVNEKEIEFSGGFVDLHTEVYKGILNGNGFGLNDAKPSIEVVHSIRNCKETTRIGEAHPFLVNIK